MLQEQAAGAKSCAVHKQGHETGTCSRDTITCSTQRDMLQGQLAGTNHVQQALREIKTKNNYRKPNQYSHRDMKLGHVAEIKLKLYTLGNTCS